MSTTKNAKTEIVLLGYKPADSKGFIKEQKNLKIVDRSRGGGGGGVNKGKKANMKRNNKRIRSKHHQLHPPQPK